MMNANFVRIVSCAAAAAALAFALSGCRHGGNGDVAQVRLIDAVPDQDGISVAVDGRTVWKHSEFGGDSGYQSVNAGRYLVRVQSGDRSGSQEIALDKGSHYTVVALSAPRASGLTVRAFGDDDQAPVPDGKARLSVIDAVPIGGAVDILLDNIVAVPGLPAGRRSEALVLNAGQYEIKINAPDSVHTLGGPETERFESGRSYTLVVLAQGAEDYGIRAYTDGG